jgi:hypothetical protein
VYKLRLLRGRSTTWSSKNPVLAQGEPAYDIDAKKFKIGDGRTRWNDLPYQATSGGGEFDGIHNDLEGRDTSDAHPMSSITGLAAALDDVSAGADGREVELSASTTHIRWRYVGGTSWTDLVALADLEGADGVDGAEVELSVSSTHIRWRYVGGSWSDLVSLADLKGDPGSDATVTAANVAAVLDADLAALAAANNSATLAATTATFTTAKDARLMAAVIDADGPVTIAKVWSGSQAQYDALGSYDPNTLYFTPEA